MLVMKLYVQKGTGEKVYLNSTAPTRPELVRELGSEQFDLSIGSFHVNDVFAETDPYYHTPSTGSTIGATVGAVVGFLAGPVGSVIGGIAGGIIGNQQSNEDSKKVDQFNNSKLPESIIYNEAQHA
ncbi:glycine zipper domain-containing protein [Pontibacter vulgaris]|uniref:glycine zipper domain-containing protein n=1 Tax=Pontibacter vulgaris TaxID=2905679 RepID=UPI001FA74051|nr:glycine zipper domain-containing protein [Pontibacter vulgaris]